MYKKAYIKVYQNTEDRMVESKKTKEAVGKAYWPNHIVVRKPLFFGFSFFVDFFLHFLLAFTYEARVEAYWANHIVVHSTRLNAVSRDVHSHIL